MWYEFFSHCLEVASKSLDKFITSNEKNFLSLPEAVINELFERGFKDARTPKQADELMRYYLKAKHRATVFELL